MDFNNWTSLGGFLLTIIIAGCTAWYTIDKKIERKTKECAEAARNVEALALKEAALLHSRIENRTREIDKEIADIKRDYVRRDDLDRRFTELSGEVHNMADKIDGLKDSVMSLARQTIDALAKSRPPSVG